MQEKRTFIAHYLADPAFAQWTPRDAIKWAQTRDPARFPEPVVGQPVEYRYQRLRRSVIYDYVQTAASDAEKYERAFGAGIVSVKRGDETWTPAERGQPGYVAASPDELEEAGISLAEAWDVGQWIYTRSILGKGSEPRLPALPSSLLAWDALERPSVGQSEG